MNRNKRITDENKSLVSDFYDGARYSRALLPRMFRRFDHVYQYENIEGGTINERPRAVKGTAQADLGIECELELNGTPVQEYQRGKKMDFPIGRSYTDMEGIVTFRGDNFRSGAAFGTLSHTPKALERHGLFPPAGCKKDMEKDIGPGADGRGSR